MEKERRKNRDPAFKSPEENDKMFKIFAVAFIFVFVVFLYFMLDFVAAYQKNNKFEL